jgi:Pyruvate phosphate dikinase, AMP/ATP-binding domain
MFTANPVSGARDEMVVHAAWGLGEAMVGGLVTPDTLLLDKATGDIKHQDMASKRVMTVGVPTGTAERPVPDAQQTQAAELARAGVTIEQLYGQPMDIEWAFHDGQLALLQARPITALPEPPAPRLEWTLPNPKEQRHRAPPRPSLAAVRDARRARLEPRDAGADGNGQPAGPDARRDDRHDQRLRLLRHHHDDRPAQAPAPAATAASY